jgi:DNA-binding MarR family transcriptional regulator
MMKMVSSVKVNTQLRRPLGRLVARFLDEMHRFDAGRTLPLLHQAQITTPQLAVLEFVDIPRTISAIADYLGLSLPATSQTVQKLVKRGLICRSEGTIDRREKQVVLAPAGESLVRAVAAARAARFEASLAVLPTQVSARLESVLKDAIGVLEHAVPADPSTPSRRNRT